MSILKSRIVHASIDENGKVSGGKVGDQTGKEVCVREWYNKPWNVVLIPNNAEISEKAVELFVQIANDSNYGYDQSERTSFYKNIIANGGKVKGAKGELDCSSGVSGVYKLAGLDISESLTTSTMKNAFIKAGFTASTDKKYLNDPTYGIKGMIYLAEGSHTALCIENGGNQPNRSLEWLLVAKDCNVIDSTGKKVCSVKAGNGITVDLSKSVPDLLKCDAGGVSGFIKTENVVCPLLWRTATRNDNIFSDKELTKKIGTVKAGQGATINNLFCSSNYTRCTIGSVSGYVIAGVF